MVMIHQADPLDGVVSSHGPFAIGLPCSSFFTCHCGHAGDVGDFEGRIKPERFEPCVVVLLLEEFLLNRPSLASQYGPSLELAFHEL
jgi:hypothetical protein